MEFVIVFCQALVIATIATVVLMGFVAALLAFFPDIADDEACKCRTKETEKND